MKTIPSRTVEKFWNKVDKHGPICVTLGTKCWIWTGSVNRQRYGVCFVYGIGNKKAHRVSWVIHKENIPDGKLVLHKCDNPQCVNPDHLFVGSQLDNVRDCINKGRARKANGDACGSRKHPASRARGLKNGNYTKPERRPRGENHGMSKLTEDEVIFIRDHYAKGSLAFGQESLARLFGVTSTTIYQIVHKKIWKHIYRKGE